MAHVCRQACRFGACKVTSFVGSLSRSLGSEWTERCRSPMYMVIWKHSVAQGSCMRFALFDLGFVFFCPCLLAHPPLSLNVGFFFLSFGGFGGFDGFREGNKTKAKRPKVHMCNALTRYGRVCQGLRNQAHRQGRRERAHSTARALCHLIYAQFPISLYRYMYRWLGTGLTRGIHTCMGRKKWMYQKLQN